MKPFTNQVWWAVLTLGIIFWITLMIVFKTEQHYDVDEYYQIHLETALSTIGALGQQGTL